MEIGLARRSVLGLGGGALALAVAGCAVRLEDDAPRIPLVPTRGPLPGESALLELLAQTQGLAKAAAAFGSSGGATVARLATLHREQATRLVTVLRAEGVPARLVTPAQAGATPAPAVPTSDTALGRLEVSALRPVPERVTAVAQADLFPMVCAVLAQRAAAAQLLKVGVPGPAGPWPSAGLAVAPLQAVRAGVYGFEVVAAQSSTADRARAASTLARLRVLAGQAQTLAGSQAPPAELGYALPFPVHTPATARRLARHVLEGLRGALAGEFAELTAAGGRGRAAAPQLIRWLGTAEAELSRWGGVLAPFPGLS
jgi:hypothetical protein